jgi:hypothetical protein
MGMTNEVSADETLKLIREMSFEDICKKQILDTLKVGNEAPEKLPSAVNMLEKLLRDELPQEYWEKVKEVENVAENFFGTWRKDQNVALQRAIYIAQEKFGLMIAYVKSKIPQELIASL